MHADRPPAPRQDTIAATLSRHLGPAVLQLFDDPEVNELYTNAGDPRVWLDSRTRGRLPSEIRLNPNEILAFLNTVATHSGQPLTPARPHLQARLPLERFRGARLQGFVPPIVIAPCFVVRKPPSVIYSLDDWTAQGVLTSRHRDLLLDHLRLRSNLLVAGGTSSGKTTFLNALLLAISELEPADRIVILEDTPELQCMAPDRLGLRTADVVSLTELVRMTLRATPERIVVGEVRDGSALDLLDAWSTGHPGGLATVHATDARGALERLDRLAMRNGVPSQRHLVAAAVQLVVVLAGGSRGRRLQEIVAVDGLDPATGQYRLLSL